MSVTSVAPAIPRISADDQKYQELIFEAQMIASHISTATVGKIDELLARIEGVYRPMQESAFLNQKGKVTWDRFAQPLQKVYATLSAILQEKTQPTYTPAQRADGLPARDAERVRWMNTFAINGQINLLCDAPVTLNCPAYAMGQGLRLPYVGHYDQAGYELGYPILTMRLHPSQIVNFPASVQAAIGNVQGKVLDLHLVVSTAETVKAYTQRHHKPQRYNLVTHGWVYPDLQPEQERKRFDIELGIFEGLGVYGMDSGDAVGYEALKKLEVYSHPVHNMMAYSPDNAHFGVVPHASVSGFWSVVKCDNRILACYHLMLNDRLNPFAQAIETAATSAFKPRRYLQNLATGLKQAQATIDQTYEPLAAAFARNDADALKKFNALDAQHQNWVFGQIWQLQNRPKDVHPDFGRASFRHEQVDPKYFATPAQRAQAIRDYAAEMKKQNIALIKTQMDLFRVPAKMIEPTKAQLELKALLEPIVALFKADKTEDALKAFSALDDKHKGQMYGIVWNLKNCPYDIHPRFGECAFFANKQIHDRYHCSNEERIFVLNMYMHQ